MTLSTSTPTPAASQLFDFPIHLADTQSGLARVQEALTTGENLHVVTMNPEMLMQAEKDAELAGILKSAGLVIPDGAGVVWALRRKGCRVNRLPGIEFSEAVLAQAAERGYRLAIIGARPEVLAKAVSALQARFAGLDSVYSHHGFFKGETEREAVAKACAETRPQVVLVALGVPAQEKWIARFQSAFQGTAFIGVGGSLDVWSGTTNRAPALFRLLNLEWLYRISSEPWRIRRVYKTLPMFVVKVLLSRP